MSPLLRIPIGFLIMFVGFMIVWKTETVYEWFGVVDWAEQKLGVGSSRLFYKLVGILVATIGVFTATNIISDILTSFASLFIRPL